MAKKQRITITPDALHKRYQPSNWDRWYPKTALFGLKNDEKCLSPMLFFLLGSRLSDTKFFDLAHLGGEIASQGHLRWPKRDAIDRLLEPFGRHTLVILEANGRERRKVDMLIG